jgi:NitT/TauT family transport system substrate-binding protein
MRSRRAFLSGLAFAGAAGLLVRGPERVAADAPAETKTVRFSSYPAICVAPQWVAADLLRAEGLTDVQYVDVPDDISSGKFLAAGKCDFSVEAAPVIPVHVDAGASMVALAGIHSGCFELFAHEPARTIRDLKGKQVSVPAQGDERHIFVSAMLAHVGLDPGKDVVWDFRPSDQGMRLFADRKVDAYLGFPPDPQELRARKIGHVLVNTLTDRPWSQYFCCVLTGSRTYVRAHPAATKRITRAILKATQICALEPERVARLMVAKGYEKREDYALQVLKQLPYARWREFSPEDTLRFYALRLHEAGMIKSSPQKIITQGADWRFLNELKRELKA